MKGNYRAVAILSILFILIIVLLSFIIYLGRSKHTSKVARISSQGTHIQRAPSSTSRNVGTINICSKQYSNYPPLSNILTTKYDPNLGVYTGTVSIVDSKLHTITVTSQRSNNSFVFNETAVNGKIYNTHSVLINTISLVPTGVKVFISFPCMQKRGIFILNRVQMVE